MLQRAYQKLTSDISKLLEKSSNFSFTTDIWTNSKTNTSYLSLTAHWLNESFVYIHRVLHCREIEGRHTGLNISANIKDMLQNWRINHNQVHLIVRDNAYNMRLGMVLSNIASIPCFIHTLQLIIKDSLFADKDVEVLLSKARKIVGHFSHSSSACEKLKLIQVGLDSTITKQTALLLVQDVPTRWNSTYLMLKRLNKLKVTVQNYVASHLQALIITEKEWQLVDQVLKLLEPFQLVTKDCSKNDALLSSVIPHARALKNFIGHQARCMLNLNAATNLAKKMEEACENRLYSTSSDLNLNDNSLLLTTTAVDPRYRLSVFPSQLKEKVKTLLQMEVKKHSSCEANERSDSPTHKTLESSKSQSSTFDPNDFLSFYSTEEEEAQNEQQNIKSDEVFAEINSFLIEENLRSHTKEADVLQWWNLNRAKYPYLASFARKCLSAPPSSVYSERLFSEAGNLYENKRNRLLPNTGEKLLLLHHNLAKFSKSQNS